MKKISQEEFERRVYEVHGKNIKILGEYINKRTKILVKCICGYKWKTNPEPLWNGHGCPKCSNNMKKTTEQFKKEVYELVKDEYEVLGEYKSTHTPILLKHNICGNTFSMSPKSFLYDNQRCPKERYKKSAESNSIPLEEIQEKINKLGEGNYEIIGEYIAASKKTKFLHKICGNTFSMQPTRFIKGGIRCPHCYRSKGEEVIRDYLKDNDVVFKEQYKIKECKNIRPLPFDFAIFEDNKLKCLIEYDGSQHYGRKFNNDEEEFLKLKRNDKIKTEFCKDNNILLMRIKFVRSENPNIFKNKLISKLEKEFAKCNMTIPSQA
ncbi:hypothetical protein [Clostridium butyricum]|jgi:hypothetical protein|uniref:hypothetical protein n=1 Tax=Clostridium butyricum TaxID=1492 RepID=UPI002AAFF224|nr:hypothetical protein [Clostridium butyricum]